MILSLLHKYGQPASGEVVFYMPRSFKDRLIDLRISLMEGSSTDEEFKSSISELLNDLDVKLFQDSVKRVVRDSGATA